jgi:hypothetical protein
MLMTANLKKTTSKENVSHSDRRDHSGEDNSSILTNAELIPITNALRRWAAKAPKGELVIEFAGEDRFLTPFQVYIEVERNTPLGQTILRILEHGIQVDGVQQIVSRLTDESV